MALALDKGELGGTAAAVLLHVVLIVALTTSLAHVAPTPEPKPMEVEFVDSPEVALTAAAPEATPAPAATSPTPSAEESEPAPPPPAAQPTPAPPPISQPTPAPPPPRPAPMPRPTPAPAPRPAPPAPRPTPPRPTPPRAAPARPAPPQRSTAHPLDGIKLPAAPRRSQLGADFLQGLGDSPFRKPAQAATSYSPEAKASIANTIAAQAQRCANRQPFLGEGADQLRLQVRLSFAKSGTLLRPPAIVAMEGPSDLQAKYGDRLEDQVRAIFTECAPFRLPPELYDTGAGGWKQTVLRYRVRK